MNNLYIVHMQQKISQITHSDKLKVQLYMKFEIEFVV